MAKPTSRVDIADPLTELALDLRWTWNHSTDDVWRELDPELWHATQNAWLVLQTVSRERLDELMSVPRWRRGVDLLLESAYCAYAPCLKSEGELYRERKARAGLPIPH